MNILSKNLNQTCAWLCAILVLVLASFTGIPSASAAPIPAIVNEGSVTLSSNGTTQSGNFPETWDLTAGDMTISFTYDANGLVDDADAHAWAELGIRDLTTASNFNPTWMVEGKGVWLATDYDWNVNTFDPDVTPTLDMDDKLILQKAGGQGEGAYNLPSTPPAPGNNHRVWWDRDGVDPWQNPATANTGGLYNIVMTLHATSATTGTAYMTINGLSQGFETDGNWNTIELTPAGMTFSGDMTRMQVFYGLYGYGATHSVNFNNITVAGVLANTPPDCSAAYASADTLWPPSHQMVGVDVLGVTDPDGDAFSVTIDSIWQDEPVNNTGDGNTAPDGVGVGTSMAWLRAERDGGGNGRVYHVGFSADDGYGGTCTGTFAVSVPKSQGKNGAAVDDGPLYDSTIP
jgi:hypothetical protein